MLSAWKLFSHRATFGDSQQQAHLRLIRTSGVKAIGHRMPRSQRCDLLELSVAEQLAIGFLDAAAQKTALTSLAIRRDFEALAAGGQEQAATRSQAAILTFDSEASPAPNPIREIGVQRGTLTVGEPLADFQGVLTGVPEYLGGSLEDGRRMANRP